MKNKVNIAELLKDCPKGMELDCPLFENLEFDRIDKDNGAYSIICCVKTEWECYNTHTFTEYGCYSTEKYSKCVIFPKGKTTWEGFVPPCQFKEGDIVVSSLGHIHILKNRSTSYIYVDFVHNANGSLCKSLTTCVRVVRLATEEEKQKLFDVIKANGYKWNEETKTLEKLPKFKVGDRVKKKDSNEDMFLAIAALRDDSNYMQWFICDDNESMFKVDKPDMSMSKFIHEYMDGWDVSGARKATVEEIIEHFKDR